MFADHESVDFHEWRNSLSNFMAPLQYAINFPIQLTNDVIDNLATQHELVQENANLREQLLFMKADMQKTLAIESENTQLRALLQSSARAGGRVLQAQILAVSPNPYLHQIIIDHGQRAGVYVGQPVLDVYGVMGQVIQVGQYSSRVLLITDNTSGIPVQDARSGERAIAIGDGGLNLLKLHDITQTMDIKVGDLLITSGLDGRYPYGYPVGTVSNTRVDDAGQFISVTVEPAARLNRSRLVMLVWPQKPLIDSEVQQGLTNAGTVPAAPVPSLDEEDDQ